MIFTWTKQFLMATGLFALLITGHTVNIAVKSKEIAEKQLKEANRTVRVSSASSHTQYN